LEAALSNFRDSLTLEPALFPELVADNIKSGQIQKFEFTAELLWKTVQAFLYDLSLIEKIVCVFENKKSLMELCLEDSGYRH